MNDFQPSNTVVNGYFYSFTYNPPSMTKGYDKSPLVFVLGPSLKSLNNFVGINMHHLTGTQRQNFISQFQRIYNFMDTERTVITEEACAKLLTGITIAYREYNKKYITNCVRINSKSICLYALTNGHIAQEKPEYAMLQWLEKRGIYHQKETES